MKKRKYYDKNIFFKLFSSIIRTKYNPNPDEEYYSSEFDMALSLNNINISLPNVTSDDISITNYAMVQPIVAYFNTNYVKIPLQLNFKLSNVS